MKKLYFCATDGTIMVSTQLPHATKEAIKSCEGIFEAIQELSPKLNMALVNSIEEVDQLELKWGFNE